MKRLLLFLTLLLTPYLCYGAIGATCVWEVRSTATANNLNGGGYTSGGTDYSQQDAAQECWAAGGCNQTNDLATDGAGTGLSSVSGGFTSAMVGNIIHITAGTGLTVGWYEITAYADANNVTIDRSATASGSAGTGYVGGAMSLASTLDDDFFEQLTPGNIVYIKAGTYTFGESINVTNDGTGTDPISIEGYNSSRGDDPVGDNRPLLSAASFDFVFDNYWIIRNLRITINTSTGLRLDERGYVENVKCQNTKSNSDAFNIGIGVRMIRCEAISNGGAAVDADDYAVIIHNYIHDSGTGVEADPFVYIAFNVIDTCPIGIAVYFWYGASIINNTIYNATNKGIYGTTGYSNTIINNLIDNCGEGASWNADTDYRTNYFNNNLWSNNTTDVINVTKGDNAVTEDITLTDPGSGDFTLPSGAGAIGAGMQIGTDQGAVGDYKWNIGVDQDDVTAVGGGGGYGAGWFIQ